MKTVYLAASGDLRLSANQTCEAAQAELEKKIVAACQREGVKVKRAHPYDPAKKHGFIDSQKIGLEVFREHPPGRAADGGRGGLAVQPPRAARPARPHRGPILTVGQLERRVARPGRHAQPERLPHQGRRPVQHPVERGLHRRLLPEGPAAAGSSRRSGEARHSATSARTPPGSAARRRRPSWAPELAAEAARATRPSWASSTRAAWACTTPSSRTSCCTRPASSRSG